MIYVTVCFRWIIGKMVGVMEGSLLIGGLTGRVRVITGLMFGSSLCVMSWVVGCYGYQITMS